MQLVEDRDRLERTRFIFSQFCLRSRQLNEVGNLFMVVELLFLPGPLFRMLRLLCFRECSRLGCDGCFELIVFRRPQRFRLRKCSLSTSELVRFVIDVDARIRLQRRRSSRNNREWGERVL